MFDSVEILLLLAIKKLGTCVLGYLTELRNPKDLEAAPLIHLKRDMALSLFCYYSRYVILPKSAGIQYEVSYQTKMGWRGHTRHRDGWYYSSERKEVLFWRCSSFAVAQSK